MSHYEEYCAAMQLVADAPGAIAREHEEVATATQAELDSALRRDRELQSRWASCDRDARDLGIRIRKLADFVGVGRAEAHVPVQPWDLSRTESELSALTNEVRQLETAMDWINRARRQVSSERGKLR